MLFELRELGKKMPLLDVVYTEVESSIFNECIDYYDLKRVETDLYGDLTVFYQSEFHGISIEIITSKVSQITLFHKDKEYGHYKGEIPFGISFSVNKSAVIQAVGKPPERFSEGASSRLLGEVPAWDRFDFDNYSLHIIYKCGLAASVTLMSVEARNDADSYQD